jgi:PKD domain
MSRSIVRVGVTILVVAVGLLTSIRVAPAAGAADCGSGGRTWPGSGQVNMSTSPRYQITMSFSMTSSEICELRKSEYLEIEYSLYGFKTAANWDNYSVSTNLPGGQHDVDFNLPTDNNANQPTPAVTAIRTADLIPDQAYYATISWQEPLQPGATPQVMFRWAPSHWYKSYIPKEAACSPAYVATRNLAWCIFADDAKVVKLFGPIYFQNATADAKRNIENSGSFVWYPAIDGSLPPHLITSGAVPTPRPINTPPVANFTYKRLTGAGNRIVFDSSASHDPDGRIVAWTWYNGIPTFSTAQNPVLSLGSATSAVITLTVTDNQGGTGTVSKTISAGNRPPAINSVSPHSGQVVGTNTPALSADATDADSDSLQYYFRIYGPSVDLNSGWIANSAWQVPAHRLDPGTGYTWNAQVRDSRGATSGIVSSAIQIAMLPVAEDVVSTGSGAGYWQVASDGGVFSYGDAQFYGSLPGTVKVDNIIGMVRTPDSAGYWLVGTDGGVFAFGDARFYGSLPGLNIKVNNIVGMAATKTGNGYWLVGSDGGVFAFGDAGFYGSMAGKPLNGPVVGISPTASGGGYWLAAADGGIFAFGDAPFYGSMGGKHLNYPVTDMDVTPTGTGYWMTAEDGGVFAFGDARFYGSMAGQPLNGHIDGMSVTPTGNGYWLTGCDGGIFAFGDAVFRGSNPTYQCRGIP